MHDPLDVRDLVSDELSFGWKPALTCAICTSTVNGPQQRSTRPHRPLRTEQGTARLLTL